MKPSDLITLQPDHVDAEIDAPTTVAEIQNKIPHRVSSEFLRLQINMVKKRKSNHPTSSHSESTPSDNAAEEKMTHSDQIEERQTIDLTLSDSDAPGSSSSAFYQNASGGNDIDSKDNERIPVISEQHTSHKRKVSSASFAQEGAYRVLHSSTPSIQDESSASYHTVYGGNERESKEDDCIPVIIAIHTSNASQLPASSAQEGAYQPPYETTQQPEQFQEGATHSGGTGLTNHPSHQEGAGTSMATVQPQEGAATLHTAVRRGYVIDPERLKLMRWQHRQLLLNTLVPDNTDDEDTWMAEVPYASASINVQDNTRTLRPSRIINYSEGISTI